MTSRVKKPRPSQKSAAHEKLRVKKIIVVIVLLALLWLFFAPGLGIISYMSKKAELKKAQDEAFQLQTANKELQQEIDKLLSDPVYLEQLAREKYDLLKPNERVYNFSKKAKKSKEETK